MHAHTGNKTVTPRSPLPPVLSSSILWQPSAACSRAPWATVECGAAEQTEQCSNPPTLPSTFKRFLFPQNWTTRKGSARWPGLALLYILHQSPKDNMSWEKCLGLWGTPSQAWAFLWGCMARSPALGTVRYFSVQSCLLIQLPLWYSRQMCHQPELSSHLPSIVHTSKE